MDTVFEEVEAIAAIFCGEREFELHHSGEQSVSFTVNVNSQNESKTLQVSIKFYLNSEYPKNIPEFSVQSEELKKTECEKLKQDLMGFSQALQRQHILLEMITWVQENAMLYSDNRCMKNKCLPDQDEELVTSLLHLDHMRAKGKYIKTIQKWTGELGLTGKLIFHEKLILIILQGSKKDIKEYIQRQRTNNVDVDSKGRSCKERMLSVLSEQDLECGKRLETFEVKECRTSDELRSIFNGSALQDLFEAQVKGVLRS